MRKKCNLVMLALSISLVFALGCAQKSVVQEDRMEPQGGAELEQTSEAKVAPAGVVEQAAATENETTDEAAARVAAMEKAAADKLAMEKATPEKTVEEKTVEEKAAEEKLAMEKATAAKAVEEKAAEEKAAEEKLAMEKATAAKAVEEKAAADKAAAEKAAEKKVYELTDINFDFDKSDLRDDARESLKKHAEWLTQNMAVKIVVEGHCDERGTAEYNLALGERRANAAAKFLMDMGIEGKRIKTISYGEELPLDQGHDEAAWAKNRRAHFVLSEKK